MIQTCRKAVYTVQGQEAPEEPPVPAPARKTTRRRPARVRLPWFRCRKCGTRLAQMDMVDGKTCVRIGAYAVSYKIEMTCEFCGTAREFVSMRA